MRSVIIKTVPCHKEEIESMKDIRSSKNSSMDDSDPL